MKLATGTSTIKNKMKPRRTGLMLIREDYASSEQILNKINSYKISYKKFNQKMKTDYIPGWKIEYENDLAKINEMVARYLLYQISEDLFGGVEEIDFANSSKEPTNHFQMRMYLGPIALWTSPFIYVDNTHKVVEERTAIEVLDDNYDTIGLINS